jgi:hypothetical protein
LFKFYTTSTPFIPSILPDFTAQTIQNNTGSTPCIHIKAPNTGKDVKFDAKGIYLDYRNIDDSDGGGGERQIA